jgi:hypothetical protein
VECARGVLHGAQVRHRGGAEIEKKLVLELARTFLRAEDFRFHELKLGRDEALGVGQRLLARVVGGDGGEIGGADFDVVAEDLVVADLERLDAGPLLLPPLEIGEPFLALDGGGAKFLERGVIPGANEAAFLEEDGRVVGQRPAVKIGEVGQRRNLQAQFAQGSDGMLFQRFAEGGELLEGDAQGDEVAGVAAALDEARDEALDIADLAQEFLEDVAFVLIRARPGDDGLPAHDGGEIAQRSEEPLTEQTSAAGGDGAIHGGEERGLARAGTQRIDQLEIAARGGVEDEDVVALPKAQGMDMAERAAQLVAEVVEQAARRTERAAERELLAGRGDEAETIERSGLEVVAEGVLGGLGGETPGVVLDQEVGQALDVAVGKRRGFEIDLVALGDDDFGGVDAAEGIAQSLRRGEFAGEEFPGGEVESRDAISNAAVRRTDRGDGGEEVVLLGLELAGVEDAAGREDLRDLALHDLARLGRFHLIADGDAAAGFEELRDVALGGVVGHAAHGHPLPLREGEIEQARALLGVGEKQLVEIAQPEEEHGVGRDFALEPVILLHHRREDIGHEGRW